MIIGIYLFILGLVIGSFLNVVIWRHQAKKSLLGRSACPSCKHPIAWFDNIPVLSYIFLSGKCRHCKKRISLQYPIVELVTGITFFLIGYFSMPGKAISVWLTVIPTGVEGSLDFARDDIWLNIIRLSILIFIASCLLLIAFYDAKTKEIPNGFNLSFVAAAAIYALLVSFNSPNFLVLSFFFLVSALFAFLFFWFFVFISGEKWMGGGDAKLAFGIGIFLGPLNTFVAILFATWLGAIYGIGVLLFGRRKTSQPKPNHEIPFGPFLVAGTFISFLFGSQLVGWYAKIFLGF